MATRGKGIQIPIDIVIDKDFVKDVAYASSEAGKRFEREMSASINRAQQTIREFQSLQKQILATGSMPAGVSASMLKTAQSASNMAHAYLSAYAEMMQASRQFTNEYTDEYSQINAKIDESEKKLAEYRKENDLTRIALQEFNNAIRYQNSATIYDALIEKAEGFELRMARIRKSIATREAGYDKQIADYVRQYDEALSNPAGRDTEKLSELARVINQLRNAKLDDSNIKGWNTQLRNLETELGKFAEKADKAAIAKQQFNKLSEEGLLTESRYKALTTQYDEETKSINDTVHALEEYRTVKKDIEASGQVFKTVGIDAEKADEVKNLGVAATQTRGALDEMGDKAEKSSNSLKKSQHNASRFKSVLHSISKTINSVIKGLIQLRHHSRRSFDSSTNGLKGALRNIMRYGLGIRSLYYLFRRLRNAAKEAFEQMAKQWDPVNQQISSMIQSLNGVKGSIATMLQPLLAGFATFFNQLMSILQKVMETIGAFFAFLTGQNYILRAKAGGVDWAASLADNLGAANDEAEELNKQLAGFDKLNNLTTNKDKDKGGKPDIGMGTVGFEKVPIEQLDLFNWLKDMWMKTDFSDLGRELNSKLLNALKKLDWDKIEYYGRKIGTCLATAINGFFEGKELAKELGKAIAGTLNTAFGFLEEFAKRTNWAQIGEFIKTGINSFLENAKTFDWGFSVGTLVRGLVTAVYSMISDRNTWIELGKKIKDGINGFLKGMSDTSLVMTGFDAHHVPIYEEINGWQATGKAFSSFADGLLVSLKEAITDINWQELGQGIGDMISSIDWTQIFIDMAGLAWQMLLGLITAWHSMTESLIASDNPFAQALGFALKTGAPDVMLDDVLKILNEVGPPINSEFSNTGTNAGKALIDSCNAEIEASDLTTNVATKVEDMATTASDKLSDSLDEHHASIVEKIIFLGEDSGQSYVDGLGNAWDNSDIFSILFDPITGGGASAFVSTWKSFGQDSGEGYKTGLESEDIGATVESIMKTSEVLAKKALEINSPSKVFQRIGQFVVQGFLLPFANLASNFANIWVTVSYNTISIISNMVNSITNIIGNLAENIGNLFSNIVDGFNSLNNINLSGLTSGLNAGASAGIKKIRVPHLATGAVIPPNKQFLAMLGDQNSGTNVEAPLSTIEDAVRNVMSEMNFTFNFDVSGDPEKIFKVVRKQSDQFIKRTGHSWT